MVSRLWKRPVEKSLISPGIDGKNIVVDCLSHRLLLELLFRQGQVAQIESIVEPDCVTADVEGPPRCGGRLAGIGGVYRYSWSESINFGHLIWQYPKPTPISVTHCMWVITGTANRTPKNAALELLLPVITLMSNCGFGLFEVAHCG